MAGTSCKLWPASAALAVLLALGVSPVQADEAEVQELRARVERLEKQLQQQQPPAANPPATPAATPAPDAKAPDPAVAPPAPPPSPADGFKDVGGDPTLRAFWNNDFFFESPNKDFRFKVGGRTQFDVVGTSASWRVQWAPGGTGAINDAVNFRRARLELAGTMYETIDFFCQYDFLNTFNAERAGDPLVANTPVPTDVWLTVTHLPYLGNVRIGNQKPPLAFEHLTSSRFLNFLERSPAFDAFVEDQDNGFRPGVQTFHWTPNERLTWALGLFKQTRSIFGWNVGDAELDVTGRVTCLPWYEDEGRCLLHLGLGASHRDLDDHQARFRSRIPVRNGPAALHTIVAEARMIGASQDLLVPELVMVVGPLSLAAEYYGTWVHGAVAPVAPAAQRFRGVPYFQGGYVEALYFLTGEHRAYNRQTGAFTRVVPYENFFWVRGEDGGRVRGRGAWQVAARYSFLDLDSHGINGGGVQDLTLGLNWFWNPNTKLQWNYSLAYRDTAGTAADGYIHGFGTRLAWDF